MLTQSRSAACGRTLIGMQESTVPSPARLRPRPLCGEQEARVHSAGNCSAPRRLRMTGLPRSIMLVCSSAQARPVSGWHYAARTAAVGAGDRGHGTGELEAIVSEMVGTCVSGLSQVNERSTGGPSKVHHSFAGGDRYTTSPGQRQTVTTSSAITHRDRRLPQSPDRIHDRGRCPLYVRGLAGVSRTRRDSAGPGWTK